MALLEGDSRCVGRLGARGGLFELRDAATPLVPPGKARVSLQHQQASQSLCGSRIYFGCGAVMPQPLETPAMHGCA